MYRGSRRTREQSAYMGAAADGGLGVEAAVQQNAAEGVETIEPFDKEHRRLARRWVAPQRRYLRVGGSAFVWPWPRRRWFQWRLRYDGRRISVHDLTLLLVDGGWRERSAATWLIVAGRRAELRPVIEQGILGDEPSGLYWDYCSALASLGTEEDARILAAYLDKALLIPREETLGMKMQCQPQALAALLYLDEQLGTDHAGRFLAAGGPWDRWPGSDDFSPLDDKDHVRRDVVFAAGGDPGIRQMLKAERRRAKR